MKKGKDTLYLIYLPPTQAKELHTDDGLPKARGVKRGNKQGEGERARKINRK